MLALQTILPVLLILLLGWALLQFRFLDHAFAGGLSRFIYWISLPALVIHSLATADASWRSSGVLTAFLLLATITVMLCSFLFVKFTTWSGATRGAFVQATFRGNLAMIGFPLLILVNETRGGDPAITANAILIVAPMMLFYNISSVLILGYYQTGEREVSLYQRLISLRSNPLILATVIGIALSILPFSLPGFVMQALDQIGKTASPLSILSIGTSLAGFHWGIDWKLPTLASLTKVVLTPAIMLAIAISFGITGNDLFILLIFAASPIAVASAILARQMNSDESLASSSVAVSTIISLIPLTLIIAWLG